MLLRPNFSPADTGSLPHCRKKRTEVTLGKSYTRGFTIRDSVQAIHKACPVSSNSFPRKKFPSLEPAAPPSHSKNVSLKRKGAGIWKTRERSGSRTSPSIEFIRPESPRISKRLGSVGGAVEYPVTSAPARSRISESQLPLKPVWPVRKTFFPLYASNIEIKLFSSEKSCLLNPPA